MRREPTPAEKRLWKLLREIDGRHFRRQAPLGPYGFDFAEMSSRLLVEVDGGVHDRPDVQARDQEKARWAAAQGFRLVRIPNSHVFGGGDPAMAIIMAALRETHE